MEEERKEEELRYTSESLSFRDEICHEFSEKMSDASLEKTLKEGRKLVTKEDMEACVSNVLNEITIKFRKNT